MWHAVHAGRFVVEEVQKLLTTWRLPSFCPASFTYSHFQCCVLWSCCEASLWQVRQAFVTSGPDLKSPCSGAKPEWSTAGAAIAIGVQRRANARAARVRVRMVCSFSIHMLNSPQKESLIL